MNMTPRPLIQDLVKEALSKDVQRVKIAAEGARQMNLAEETSKEASDSSSDEIVTTDFAMKLASAVEYALPEIVKAAEGPGAAPPEGVSASQQNQVQPFTPGSQGQGHAQPPKNPGTQKAVAGAATQMENTADHHVPGTQTTALSGGKGKTAGILAKLAGSKTAFALTDAGHKLDAADYASARDHLENMSAARKNYEKDSPLMAHLTGENVNKTIAQLAARHHNYSAKKHEDKRNAYNPFGGLLTKTDREKKEASAPLTLVDNFLAATKVAEDAINPAKISAGAAVPPESSAAGEPGGAPVAGMPQGPRSLVHSNESARDYKKGTAYAPRKAELKQYFNEPALTSATDKTLQQAFAHTGEAGVKISSAPQVKTAAARAILMKLAEGTAKKAG